MNTKQSYTSACISGGSSPKFAEGAILSAPKGISPYPEPIIPSEELLFSCLLPQINHCDFGEERLDKRFVNIINTFITGDSSQSLPVLFKNQHALKGLYRFVNNNSVSHDLLLEGYQDGLVELCELMDVSTMEVESAVDCISSNRYYALFDTTFGMFNARKKLELGYIETKKDNGMVIHNGLLINSKYEPLGLLHQEIILRDRSEFGKSKERQKRSFEEKESYKWVKGFHTLEEFICRTGCSVVGVLDREGDVKEVINAALAVEQLEFVIRSQHNRKVYLEGEQEAPEVTKLWDDMRLTNDNVRVITRELRNDKGKIYKAKCELKYKSVQLNNIDAFIQVVYLKELNPPNGEKAAEWLLLTSLEVENFEQAEEIVEIYTKRWAVEDFHKCLKTGCSFEERQFDSPEAIANILGILSLVAVFLLRLRYLAKNYADQNVTRLFQSPLLPFVNHIAPNYLKNKDLKYCKVGTVKWFCLLLGRMGGHQGIATKGLPGWQSLWRGWIFLQHLLTGYGLGLEMNAAND